MADLRFFSRKGPFKLAELAKFGGAELAPDTDANYTVEDVATLFDAQTKHVSFFDNRKYLDALKASKAGACILHPDAAAFAPRGMQLLLSKNPYKSYAKIAAAFYPSSMGEGFQHPTAVIGKNVKIGERCRIEANVTIGDGVMIGDDTVIMANATLSHCIIGARCVIYPGARIGQPGFGFAPDVPVPVKVPQLGRVIIGDDVEVGANSTIDRGALGDTEIGSGTMIDNLVQIAHNVKIGKGCVIVSQVGISGSTVIEDYVMLGGQAGLAGHLKIGRGAKVAAQAGLMRDVEAGEMVGGSPAMPIKQWHRQTAYLTKQSTFKKKAS